MTTAGSVHSMEMLGKGVIHILGRTVQYCITLFRMVHKFKTANCLFVKFSMEYFGPWLITGNKLWEVKQDNGGDCCIFSLLLNLCIEALKNIKIIYRLKIFALAGVAQWIECQPVNQRVACRIPSQGTCLGCGPGFLVGGA